MKTKILPPIAASSLMQTKAMSGASGRASKVSSCKPQPHKPFGKTATANSGNWQLNQKVDNRLSKNRLSNLRNVASLKKNIIFEYDPMGNRIAKHQYSNTPADLGSKRFDINNPLGWEKTTYYNRDAQGNVMAVYDYDIISSSVSYLLSERNIYGSSRVGINTDTVEMIATVSTGWWPQLGVGKIKFD